MIEKCLRNSVIWGREEDKKGLNRKKHAYDPSLPPHLGSRWAHDKCLKLILGEHHGDDTQGLANHNEQP